MRGLIRRGGMLLSKSGLVGLTALLAVGFTLSARGEDWPRFRGADGSGVAQASGLPTTWDSEKNVVWKTKLPGLGTSSPVVFGKRIYLTCYSGYAESENDPGDQSKLMRHVTCLDRGTGKLIWSKEFEPKGEESKYSGGNNSKHGYASSTIATDGKLLYVFFGISGVFALDLDGNVKWNRDVGSGTHGWGSATSPLLYKNLVIVNAGVESGKLYGLDKATGDIVWQTPGVKSCWASPLLVDVGGKQEMVLNMPNKVTGFDPATGKELWNCNGIPDSYVCPTAIVQDGVVYVIGGRKNTAIAVRPGGQGNVTNSHVLWRVSKGSNVSSPVYLDGHIYWFHEGNGTVYCLNAKTGDVVYEGKLEPRPGLIYASATAADGKLYAPSRDNGTYVVAAKPKFEQLALNKFQDDSSRVNASVVVTDNQLLLRTDQALYCIGQ